MDGCVSRPPQSRSSWVRVVAKFVDLRKEAQSSENDPARMRVSFSEDGRAFVSARAQAKYSRSTERSVYQLDNCYEEEKGVEEIYEVEVRPLVQRLFDGTNCSVISYGAHRSWPAQHFQGSGEIPSLVEKTMSEILYRNGKGIEISDYEVFQDQIYDLLEQKEKSVQLKNLSRVKVNTVDELKSYYCQKDGLIRGHRGIIIYTSHSSKFNFLDLGGYGGATENKSLHAVMKIVYALNSKNFISYRDNRFTHQMRDFLSFESESVVIACLSRNNNQQNRRALMLASSSSQAANQIQFNTIRRPTKKYVTPLEKRCSMSVNQMKPVYEKVNRRALVRHSIKKPGFLKERVQSHAAKSMAKLTLDEDLFKVKQAGNSISEGDTHGELDGIQESTMPGMKQEPLSEGRSEAMSTINIVVNNEESAESVITNGRNLDIQQKDISSASEELEWRAVIEEPSSNHITPEHCTAEVDHRTPARLTEPSSHVKMGYSSCMRFRDSSLQVADMSQESLMECTTDMKNSLQRGCLTYINSAKKEGLKRLKGIGEVRANRILQLRDNNPEPFKDVKDLKNIGITPRLFDKMVLNFFEDS